MKDNTELRADKRCCHQASVTCAYFNSDRFYHVKATNHSKDGISLFADFPLKPRASIYVRVDSYSPGGGWWAWVAAEGCEQWGWLKLSGARKYPVLMVHLIVLVSNITNRRFEIRIIN